jgi:hypothetical protein
MDDEGYKINKSMDNEKTDRNLKGGNFKDTVTDTLKKQKHYIANFQTKTTDNFKRLREELEYEMDGRFDAQDEIVDNMSNAIKTFQDTMKIVGQTL